LKKEQERELSRLTAKISGIEKDHKLKLKLAKEDAMKKAE
jgi:hypothetical protein